MPLVASLWRLLFCASTVTASRTFYVSSQFGDDKHTAVQAQSPLTPWRGFGGLEPHLHLLRPSDTVLFATGGEYFGSLSFNVSGTRGHPITFASYVPPQNTSLVAPPVFSATVPMPGGPDAWKPYGDFWSITLGPSFKHTRVYNFFDDGVLQTVARAPNRNPSDTAAEWYRVSGVDDNCTGNSFYSWNLTEPTGFWDNATLRIRTSFSVYETHEVASYVFYEENNTGWLNTTLEFFNNVVQTNWGFYLENKLEVLDQPGEWFYDRNLTILYYWPPYDGPPKPGAQAVIRINSISLEGLSYITIRGIHFQSHYESAINATNCQFFVIADCIFENMEIYGATLPGLQNSTVANNTFVSINGAGLRIDQTAQLMITGNTFSSIGLLPGHGYVGSVGIILGNMSYHNTIARNAFDQIGYSAMTIRGVDHRIESNVIMRTMMTLADGGGVYMGAVVIPGAIDGIGHHFVDNVVGPAYGDLTSTNAGPYWNGTTLAQGIYLDANSTQMLIQNNIVFGCNSGIYLHCAFNNLVVDNTIFNCSEQITVRDTPLFVCPSFANKIANNSLSCLAGYNQTVVNLFSWYSQPADLAYGAFANNEYCCDNATSFTMVNTTFVPMNVCSWEIVGSYNQTLSFDSFEQWSHKVDELNSTFVVSDVCPLLSARATEGAKIAAAATYRLQSGLGASRRPLPP